MIVVIIFLKFQPIVVVSSLYSSMDGCIFVCNNDVVSFMHKISL